MEFFLFLDLLSPVGSASMITTFQKSIAQTMVTLAEGLPVFADECMQKPRWRSEEYNLDQPVRRPAIHSSQLKEPKQIP
jgi:hypothetical protein